MFRCYVHLLQGNVAVSISKTQSPFRTYMFTVKALVIYNEVVTQDLKVTGSNKLYTAIIQDVCSCLLFINCTILWLYVQPFHALVHYLNWVPAMHAF